MYTTDQMIEMSYTSYLYARGTINSSLNILTRASPGNPLVRFSYRNAMSLNLHLITWYVTMCQLSFSLNVLNRWLELLPKYLEQVCLVLFNDLLCSKCVIGLASKMMIKSGTYLTENLSILVQILSMPTWIVPCSELN